MSSQIRLPLNFEKSSTFIVSPANAVAAAGVEAPHEWPDGAAILVGPARSGKSLLARFLSSAAGEAPSLWEDWDIGPGSETALFHDLNRARDGEKLVLITARTMPGAWRIALPDLRSRIRALPVFEIGLPDDTLLTELLARKLEERGLAVPPDVILSAVRRMERSYEALDAVVDRIDSTALEQGRRVSVRMVTDVLKEGEPGSE